MNGHKGSVAMYPVQEGYDSLQGMILQFVESIDKLNFGFSWGIGSILKDIFVDTNVLNDLSKEWRQKLGLTDPDIGDAVDSTSEDFYQNVYNSIATSYSANSSHDYAIRTKYRIQSFDTKGKTDETYKYYEITGVSVSNLSRNEKVKSLYYINRDDDIWKAIADNRFVISHSKQYTNLVTIPFESGTEKVPVFVKDGVIDTPLVQEDVLFILKNLVNDKNLNKGTIHFKSGARFNDNSTWKNTGFMFILEYKGSDKKLDNALKEIQNNYIGKEGMKLFDYKKQGSKFMISVYPPKQSIAN